MSKAVNNYSFRVDNALVNATLKWAELKMIEKMENILANKRKDGQENPKVFINQLIDWFDEEFSDKRKVERLIANCRKAGCPILGNGGGIYLTQSSKEIEIYIANRKEATEAFEKSSNKVIYSMKKIVASARGEQLSIIDRIINFFS